MTVVPLDQRQARRGGRTASRLQRQAEQVLRDAGAAYAGAEKLYKRALADEIERLHKAGVAWTVCGDLARGEENVSNLREIRDQARVNLDAAKQAVFRASQDRKDQAFYAEWSMRRELAEGYGSGPEPAWSDGSVIGGRRVA